MKSKALCFDWDGTIIDSMQDKFENFIDAVLKAFEIDDSNENIKLLRAFIDFCHKEYGGELRVLQFDNVVNSLSHPFDALRLMKNLVNSPAALEESPYLRERHLYSNYKEEINGEGKESLDSWVHGVITDLSDYLLSCKHPFPEFVNLHDRRAHFDIFNEEYSRLNVMKSEDWKAFPAACSVLTELSRDHDLYVGSSLLRPLLIEETKKYPEINDLFVDIYGGDKSEALRTIKSLGYENVLFVGDMPADRVAAEDNGLPFYRIHPQGGQGNIDWTLMTEKVIGF